MTFSTKENAPVLRRYLQNMPLPAPYVLGLVEHDTKDRLFSALKLNKNVTGAPDQLTAWHNLLLANDTSVETAELVAETVVDTDVAVRLANDKRLAVQQALVERRVLPPVVQHALVANPKLHPTVARIILSKDDWLDTPRVQAARRLVDDASRTERVLTFLAATTAAADADVVDLTMQIVDRRRGGFDKACYADLRVLALRYPEILDRLCRHDSAPAIAVVAPLPKSAEQSTLVYDSAVALRGDGLDHLLDQAVVDLASAPSCPAQVRDAAFASHGPLLTGNAVMRNGSWWDQFGTGDIHATRAKLAMHKQSTSMAWAALAAFRTCPAPEMATSLASVAEAAGDTPTLHKIAVYEIGQIDPDLLEQIPSRSSDLYVQRWQAMNAVPPEQPASPAARKTRTADGSRRSVTMSNLDGLAAPGVPEAVAVAAAEHLGDATTADSARLWQHLAETVAAGTETMSMFDYIAILPRLVAA